MAKRHYEVSDEIIEHLAETIGEMTAQIDCKHEDQMVEIDQDTPETLPLTDRIQERYTAMHLLYFTATIAD